MLIINKIMYEKEVWIENKAKIIKISLLYLIIYHHNKDVIWR